MSNRTYKPQTLEYYPYPTTEAFHNDNSQIRGILGPIGSSKSSACCCELRFRALDQEPDSNGWRRTSWVVTRQSYPALISTTMKIWAQWNPQAKIKMTPPMVWHWRQENAGTDEDGNPDGTHIDMEVNFMSVSDLIADINKIRSLNITGVWVNEAQEVEDVGIIKYLFSRCGRFPDPQTAPLTWSGLIMDANAMDLDHWWYHYAEVLKPAGWKFFHQAPAVLKIVDPKQIEEIKKGNPKSWRQGDRGIWIINPECENVQGQPKHEQYWLDQIEGNHESWIGINLEAKYGQSLDGRPVYIEFDETRHVAKEDLKPVPGVPLQLGFDYGLCYSKDTEVLTSHGWKFFKDVSSVDDTVATLNPNTKEVSYTKINFKIERPHKGEMLHFKTQNMDFVVTPEHRVPNTRRDTPSKIIFNSAEELKNKTTSHRYIQLAGKWIGEKYSLFGLSENLSMKFWGWYLSEGSHEWIGNSCRISISQKHYTTELEATLYDLEWDKIGIKWRKSGPQYRATTSAIGKLLKPIGLAHDKYIPIEVKQASQNGCRIFLETFLLGDGHKRTKAKKDNGIGRKQRGEWVCATVSTRLKDDIQELCMKAGWCSRAILKHGKGAVMKDGRKIPPCSIWMITIKRIDRAEIKPNSVSSIEYDDMIYCLNVPFHTLYIRRNGRPCWNGNTPACAICQITPQGQLRIIDEVCGFDMGMRRFLRDALKPLLATSYFNFPVSGIGEPAGNQRAQSDESTAMDEIRSQGIECRPAPTNLFNPRRDAVASFMVKRVPSLITGKPTDEGFVVSPRCKMVLKGLRGDYKFKRVKVENKDIYQPEAVKNECSHIQDAIAAVAVAYDRPRMDIQARNRMGNSDGSRFEIKFASDYPII